jgi:hypothetical protein
MKKLLTILFGALVALSLFVTTGNTAKAAMADKGCGCDGEVFGVEKNKVIADLLSSSVDFKNVKHELNTSGYSFKGSAHIVVAKEEVNTEEGTLVKIITVVPFYAADGQLILAGFVNGQFGGALNPATGEVVLMPLSPESSLFAQALL